MAAGFVKLYRKLLDDPIWSRSTPEQKTILITILLLANHKSNKWEWQGEKFEVRPGQFVTSIESLRKASGKGISTQNVRSALKRFKKCEFLTNKSTKTGRLITVTNWALYQAYMAEGNKEGNKEVTKPQQRGNKELTPNKNDKNDKKHGTPAISTASDNGKRRFVKPTPEQVTEYAASIGYPLDGQEFVDKNDGIGWVVGKTCKPMKDWRGVVRTWKRNFDKRQAAESARLQAQQQQIETDYV